METCPPQAGTSTQTFPGLGRIYRAFSKPWNAKKKQRIFFLNLVFVCFIWPLTGATMGDFWDSLDGLPWDAGACWDVAALRQNRRRSMSTKPVVVIVGLGEGMTDLMNTLKTRMIAA
ncbi:MAG: hypothetical protein NTY53_22205, partial [Kiritimatiellaeota bacterium]|nr:hypothetical protein [Kiritimatiellota bacterium]